MTPTPTTHPSGVTPRRRIEFKPKMQEQFKERILAVAWITAQQPGGVFEAKNVAVAMTAALAKAGYAMPKGGGRDYPHRPIVTAMRWLEDNGYGLRSLAGKMHIAFMIDADVQVPTPPFVMVRQARTRAAEQHAAEVIAPCPPLPGLPTSPPWLERLDAALSTWWRTDMQAATRWANAALESLEARQ